MGKLSFGLSSDELKVKSAVQKIRKKGFCILHLSNSRNLALLNLNGIEKDWKTKKTFKI